MGTMIVNGAKCGLSEAELVHCRQSFPEPCAREDIRM